MFCLISYDALSESKIFKLLKLFETFVQGLVRQTLKYLCKLFQQFIYDFSNKFTSINDTANMSVHVQLVYDGCQQKLTSKTQRATSVPQQPHPITVCFVLSKMCDNIMLHVLNANNNTMCSLWVLCSDILFCELVFCVSCQ